MTVNMLRNRKKQHLFGTKKTLVLNSLI